MSGLNLTSGVTRAGYAFLTRYLNYTGHNPHAANGAAPVTRNDVMTGLMATYQRAQDIRAMVPNGLPEIGREIDARIAQLNALLQTIQGNVNADLDQVNADLTDIKRDLDDTERGLLRVRLDTLGVNDGHTDGFMRLRHEDPQTATAAMTALDALSNRAGGDGPATAQSMQERAQATAAAQAECMEKVELFAAAKKTRKQTEASLAAMSNELDVQMEWLDRQRNPPQDKVQEIRHLHNRVQQLTADVTANRTAEDQAKLDAEVELVRLEAAEAEEVRLAAKKALADALAFGRLSPDHPQALPPAQARTLIALFEEAPGLAMDALRRLPDAQEPGSVVTCARAICDRLAIGHEDGEAQLSDPDATDGRRRRYIRNLLDMSAKLPMDQMQHLDAYLAADRMSQNRDALAPGRSETETGKKRVDYLTARMVQANGTLDIAQAKDAMLDIMFHPASVRDASSAQTLHMLKTVDYFENDLRAQMDLLNMTAPQPAANALVCKAAGKDPNTENASEADARIAVVSAMMTPVFQGKVGSCFITAELKKLREEQPATTLNKLIDLATTGTFTPEGSTVAVPAVINVQQDENTLLRSFEYSAATATTRIQHNKRAQQLDSSMDNGFKKGIEKKLKNLVIPASQDAVKARATRALKDDFKYQYIVEEHGDATADGRSTSGYFALVHDGHVIKDEDDFAAAVARTLGRSVKPAELKAGATQADVENLANRTRFLDAAQSKGRKAWSKRSGGLETEASKVLFGADHDVQELTEKCSPRRDIAKLSQEVLEALTDNFRPAPGGAPADDFSPVATRGGMNHGFNFLPNDPSVAAISGANSDEAAANIKRELVDKAKQAAKTKLPLEKTIYLFERELSAASNSEDVSVRAAIAEAMKKYRPTEPMTPKKLAAQLKRAQADINKVRLKNMMDQKNADVAARGRMIPKKSMRKLLEAKKAELETDQENALRDKMIKEMGLIAIKFADTNWGGPKEHEYFVLAPDPLAGKPNLFLKSDPGGKLIPVSDAGKWLSAEWSKLA